MSAAPPVAPVEVALRVLAPEGVSTACAAVGALSENTPDYSEELAHLRQAAPHRRDEFLAGRDCARRALTAAGFAAGPLPADGEGLPVWPSGVLGSISHCRGLACAVAASNRDYRMLGVDLEKTNRLSSGAQRRILHPAEARWAGADQCAASLLFSAKEAFFKAQYPLYRAHPGFRDLAFVMDGAAERLRVIECGDHLPEALREAVEAMQFRYRYFGDFVLTLTWRD